MTRFTVTTLYRRPPGVVARWWLDYREDDGRFEDDLRSRKVERVDATHIHLTDDRVRGRRKVHMDGTVEITGPTDWSHGCEVEVNGRPFARETISFHLEAVGTDQCKLVAAFEWTPRSLLARVALPWIRGSLRKEREEAYVGYSTSIDAEPRAPQEGGPTDHPAPEK
jgi:hypothetical protein